MRARRGAARRRCGEYIDWTFFFHAWELKGAFPAILEQPAARELYDDAQRCSTASSTSACSSRAASTASGRRRPTATTSSSGDDGEPRFCFLRQQADLRRPRPNRSLADFVAPAGDHVGAFAVTAGIGADALAARFEAEHDDYHAIMVKALADRLAEAFAEYLHELARREWYETGPKLEHDDLIEERYRGIRPAFGYPACPDHTEKRKLFELLGAERVGIALTESFAMTPAASVSGLYLAPPGGALLLGRARRPRPGRGLRGAEGRAARGGRALARGRTSRTSPSPTGHGSRPTGRLCEALRYCDSRRPEGAALSRMRTTLKRGMGRATVNGNGRAVLPPGALEPMHRYRQPEPPRTSTGRLVGKVFGWIVLALLVVGSGLAGGLYLYGHETLSAIAPHTKAVKAATQLLTKVPPPSQPATALLIGYDARAGADGFGASGSRSDTVMLIRADPQQNTLSMLSFPRDLVVPIYCKDPNVVYTHDRINSAWTCGSASGTLNTVQKLTGIPINYLITIDFHGFKLLVNKLHGIYIDVDHRYYIPPHTGTATIDLEPGYERLDGQQALDFVRFRHTDSDVYRNARQQLFIEALKDRLASGFSVLSIPKLIGALEAQHRDRAGRVLDVRAEPVGDRAYAGLAYNLPSGHLFRDSIQNLQPTGRTPQSSSRRRATSRRPSSSSSIRTPRSRPARTPWRSA